MTGEMAGGGFVGPSAKIAEDVVVGRNTVITGNVKIGKGTRLGNNVSIEGDVEIGEDNYIGHNCVIVGPTTIGRENTFVSHCSVGQLPQHPEIRKSTGGVVIGDRNVFREFVTVHAPAEVRLTSIGDDCYIMSYCHIAHDCTVRNKVRMANNATLAGGVSVGDFANFGLHVVVHQGLRVGTFSMMAMNSTITKHVPPFALIQADRFLRLNRIGMQRNGFEAPEIASIERWYRAGEGQLLSPRLKETLDEFGTTVGNSKVYKFRV